MSSDRIEPTPFAEGNSASTTRSLQVAHAGTLAFGIFIDEIAGIEKWREPTPLPYAPTSVLGVVSIQGRMLTVLDLARLSDGEAESAETTPQQLIALRGDEQLAVAVDTVDEILEAGEPDFETRSDKVAPFVLGVLHQINIDIHLLNVKELFPTAIQGRERRRRRF